MNKNIKLFETHAAYNTYINGQDKVLPNVSYCVDNNEVHYNPLFIENRLIITYDVEDESVPTLLYNYGTSGAHVTAVDKFVKVEIDDVVVSPQELDNAQGKYQLTVGEHTVKYTLTLSTTIQYAMFADQNGDIPITNIEIPSNIETIGISAFYMGTKLTSVVIPSNVTKIDTQAFFWCENLSSVTVEATTPPTTDRTSFQYTASNLVIYVPSESVDAYKAAEGWSDYASKIQAIP